MTLKWLLFLILILFTSKWSPEFGFSSHGCCWKKYNRKCIWKGASFTKNNRYFEKDKQYSNSPLKFLPHKYWHAWYSYNFYLPLVLILVSVPLGSSTGTNKYCYLSVQIWTWLFQYFLKQWNSPPHFQFFVDWNFVGIYKF